LASSKKDIYELFNREDGPKKSLDASGGRVFRNLIGAAQGALIRAAASTQIVKRQESRS